MKNLKKELKAASQFAKSIFEEFDRPNLQYHDLEHTKSVVSKCKEIAENYSLTDEEQYILITSAWLHDIGYYINNNGANHEIEGVKVAMEYLLENEMDTFVVESVKGCIMATKIPQSPNTLLQEIICDADLFHLGTNEFMERQRLLKQEMEFFKKTDIDKVVWLNDTIQLMETHEFHTSYCKALLSKTKLKNLKKLKEKLEQTEKKTTDQEETPLDMEETSEIVSVEQAPAKPKARSRAKAVKQESAVVANADFHTASSTSESVEAKAKNDQETENEVPVEPNTVIVIDTLDNDDDYESEQDENGDHNEDEKNQDSKLVVTEDVLVSDKDNEYLFFKKKVKKKDQDKKKKKTSRGVETVFRVTSSNNQQLSAQADNKASIMITVNSIIISVLLSFLISRLEDQPNLLIPTLVLLIVNVGTIIFSVLATRPNIPSGMFNGIDVQTQKVNLLFFGNFYKMNLQDYSKGMLAMMDDRDFLYGSLIQDVYNQGLVLAKKYKLLRISYNIFMYGIVISVIAFVISSVAFAPETVIH